MFIHYFTCISPEPYEWPYFQNGETESLDKANNLPLGNLLRRSRSQSTVTTYTVGSRPLPAERLCAQQAVDALAAMLLSALHPPPLRSWCADISPARHALLLVKHPQGQPGQRT